jgi:Putative 2OG-Fe(II) oxygenase
VLFESWLRHEVALNRRAAERVSISFNYGWSGAAQPAGVAQRPLVSAP